MNIIDKAISFFSPGAGLQRVRSRSALKTIEEHGKRRFEGGANGHRFDGFSSKVNQSFNQVIQADQKNLVMRSRDLAINNPYAKRAVRLIANNVVGGGIVPTPNAVGKSKKDLEIVKRALKKWGLKTTCDYDGKHNFYGLQKLVMRTVVTSGECLVIKKDVASSVNEVGLQLLVLEGEWIDKMKHTYTGGSYNGGEPYDYYGIRYDGKNKIVGYWIYDRHPLEGNLKSTFVSVEKVIHVFDVERPQQNRGVPFSSSTILKQRDLDDYEDAEIVSKKVAASFAGFVQNTDPEAAATTNERLESIEPGTISYLNPNESMTFPTPPQNPGYPEFIKAQLRAIAAGYGVTYEQLSNDYSNVNFSSGRMGWIEFARQVDDWQNMMLVPQFCERAYEWFLQKCKVAHNLKPENVDVNWTAPRREMIDPVKELNALRTRARAGLASWQETVREMGFNPEDVLRQLTEDQKAFEAAGLMPDSNPLFELMAKISMNKGDTGNPDNTDNTDKTKDPEEE